MNQVSDYGIETKDKVTLHKLHSINLQIGYARALTNLKNVLKKINPDIVHVHCLHLSLFQICSWKQELGYGVISELHHPIMSLEKPSARAMFPIAFSLMRLTCKNIDWFIAHTILEQNWLLEKGITERKIIVVRFPGCFPCAFEQFFARDIS